MYQKLSANDKEAKTIVTLKVTWHDVLGLYFFPLCVLKVKLSFDPTVTVCVNKIWSNRHLKLYRWMSWYYLTLEDLPGRQTTSDEKLWGDHHVALHQYVELLHMYVEVLHCRSQLNIMFFRQRWYIRPRPLEEAKFSETTMRRRRSSIVWEF